MNPLWLALWAFLMFSQSYANAEAEANEGAEEDIMGLQKLGMVVESYSGDVVQDPATDLGPRPCGHPYKKIGCYKDKRKSSQKTMNDLLFQDVYNGKGFSGKKVDWNNWGTYLPALVCRCAQAAVKKRYTFFGVQNYGECWSSGDAGRRYDIYGEKTDCVDTFYKECDVSNNEPCVGKPNRNFVYAIEEAASGGGPPVNPDE